MALPFGPKGVAFAYSVVMTLWVGPVIARAVHGTAISFRDVLAALSRPLASSSWLVVSLSECVYSRRNVFSFAPSAFRGRRAYRYLPRGLVVDAEQRSLYLDLFRGLKRPASVKEKGLITA
jgi:hypothetical protein